MSKIACLILVCLFYVANGQFDLLTGTSGIGKFGGLPNPIQRLPNPIQRLPDPIQRLPNPIQRLPNPIQRLPNPAQAIPDLVTLEKLFLQDWLDFQTKFNKKYNPVEAPLRKANFLQNIDTVIKLAQATGQGALNFGLKINEFADMLFDEFNDLFNGFNRNGQLSRRLTSSKKTFKKHYDTAEAPIRKINFLENINTVTNFPKETALSFGQKINEFADLTFKEFDILFNGFNRNDQLEVHMATTRAVPYKPRDEAVLPKSVDWREEGVITSVKNQHPCAGCWAFSAAAAMESHIALKTGKLRGLSAQHLLDCAGEEYYNDGCDGGLLDSAFDFIIDHGISRNTAYPFNGTDGICKPKRGVGFVSANGYVAIPSGDEEALAQAVASEGPISAALHITMYAQFYADRIFEDPTCGNRPEDLNHAVLIVGYGEEDDGRKYWLIKNSYGKSWGLDGYIKLARDEGNMCGIATYARFPVL